MTDQETDLALEKSTAVPMETDQGSEMTDQQQVADTTSDQLQLEPSAASTAYSVFIPNFEQEKEATLISSSFDRYNDTIRNSLEKDVAVIQQKVNLPCQLQSNNFFRNAKWSPDGSCLLTNSADDVIRLFQLYDKPFSCERRKCG